jgi:4,5-dihydroxyphthalate decarboxylase
MHLVAIRRPVYEKNRWIAKALLDAFTAAKDKAQAYYNARLDNLHSMLMLPLVTEHQAEIRRLMGEDYWPYGIARNRKVLETFLRYHHEQGLSKRPMTPEELFVPEVQGT